MVALIDRISNEISRQPMFGSDFKVKLQLGHTIVSENVFQKDFSTNDAVSEKIYSL